MSIFTPTKDQLQLRAEDLMRRCMGNAGQPIDEAVVMRQAAKIVKSMWPTVKRAWADHDDAKCRALAESPDPRVEAVARSLFDDSDDSFDENGDQVVWDASWRPDVFLREAAKHLAAADAVDPLRQALDAVLARHDARIAQRVRL